MTKAEKDLAKAIVKDGYAELTSDSKKDAAAKLAHNGLVRVFGKKDGSTWAKALTRASLDKLADLE